MGRREEKLAEILLSSWDPLFIADVDAEPESEYLFEAGRLVELLDAGCELADVRSFLVSASEELNSNIGLPTLERAANAVWEFHRTEEES